MGQGCVGWSFVGAEVEDLADEGLDWAQGWVAAVGKTTDFAMHSILLICESEGGKLCVSYLFCRRRECGDMCCQ